MKTDDQKDEYAQRVNHEKEDRDAESQATTASGPLVERLLKVHAFLPDERHSTLRQAITDAITALSTAPSGCAEAGERVPEWTVDAVEYDKLYLAACALRSACKSRLPPGHYAKLDEEYASIDAIRNAPKHETPDEFLARPSPSPAGGADGERLMKFAGIILDQHYNDGEIGDVDGFFIQEQATECGLLEVVTRNEPCGEGCACADAGDFPTQCFIRSKPGEACIDAATQATPAKEDK